MKKTLLQIEKEINDFLQDKDFLKVKESLEYESGSVIERVDELVKYINEYIKDNIDESICVYRGDFRNFFDYDRYVPIMTEYILPDGTKEMLNIGTLYAFSSEQDVMNMRIWSNSTYLYVRFNEKYLYGDTYHLYSSRTYKPFTLDNVHKMIIKKRKDEIIKVYKAEIKEQCSIIKKQKIRRLK